MKKIVAALGLWILVLSPSLEAMESNHEIVNGLSGMQRDIVLRLCDLLWNQPGAIKNIIGMCDEHYPWKGHSYFVKLRKLALLKRDTIDLANSFGKTKFADINKIDIETLTIPYSDPKVVPFLKGLSILKKPTDKQFKTILDNAARFLVFQGDLAHDGRRNVYEVLKFLTQQKIGSDLALRLLCCLSRFWLANPKKLAADKEYREELILMMLDFANIDHILYGAHENPTGTICDLMYELTTQNPTRSDISESYRFLREICKGCTFEELIEKLLQGKC
ncbi:hypothetical protein FACS1894122_01610 [Alphaproteobacteria bacterium]|nr:hypothetical protein FACS1894122_01610 [Alphaproteobacteria bacterium]